MKVKVIREFRDRTKGLEPQKVGTVLEATKERAAILIARGLVEACEEPAKEKK